MKTTYEELLKRARSQLPTEVPEHRRFEVPRARSGTVGMRTYLVNYREIAQYLNRDPQHLLHYLSKELATAGTIDGARAIFQGKFGSDTLDRTIQRYIEEYIICPVCKRPDTKIVREKRLSFIVCEACGARNPVKTT